MSIEHRHNSDDAGSGEEKILEYVRRIDSGESATDVMQGLPTNIQRIITGKLRTPSQDDDLNFIPSQYSGLSSEVLQELWNPPMLVDEAKNRQAHEQKTRGIAALKRRELEVQSQSIESVGETEQGHELKIPVSSREVSNSELFKFSDSDLDLAFLNNDHGQDAFAVRNNVVVVSDGMSSYGKSGIVSGMLSERIADQSENGKLADVFDDSNIKAALNQISQDDDFKDVERIEGNYKERGSGLATLLVLKKNEDRSMEFASIGDSPLFAYDFNEKGDLISFSLVNGDVPIDHTNYTSLEARAEFEDPQTHGVGIREDGKFISDTAALKMGRIEYKPGRVVVAASDFYTKMLTFCPEALKARAEQSPVSLASKLYLEKKAQFENKFSKLWIRNSTTGELTIDPLFVKKLGKSELQTLLTEWKDLNVRSADDITISVIEMGK